VNQAAFFLAENRLKGAAASRTVHGSVFRPPGIAAVQITEFHSAIFPLYVYLFHPLMSMDFQLSFSMHSYMKYPARQSRLWRV